jgi:uncharacterized protein (TIRG00374 family)
MTDLWHAVYMKRRQALYLLAILLTFYLVLPQLGTFRASKTQLAHTRLEYALLAVIAMGLTYVAAAGTYSFLAFKYLNYGDTILVQMAGNFVNRLLPAGIGALGANYAYLRRSKYSSSQAVTVVSVNNILGVIGHILIVALTIGFFRKQLQSVPIGHVHHELLWLLTGASLILLIAAFFASSNSRLQRAGHEISAQIRLYRQRPARLLGALVTSMALTLCNVLSLWYCTQALHTHLSFVTVLLVFTLGVGVGTVTPSPGGLGGVEAGLVAGFVAYHLTSAEALAVALLYRLITYWLPLILGAFVFVFCVRRELFSRQPAP